MVRRKIIVETPQNQADSWKQQMFMESAEDFIEILEAKPISKTLKQFVNHLKPASPNRFAILDLGCGIGRLFPALSEVGTIVIGIDYSEELVTKANKIACSLQNVIVLLRDMRELGDIFQDASFDLVLRAYTSLGYFTVDSEMSILSQCAKLVKPGGHLVVDTFNADWFKSNGVLKRNSLIGSFELEEQYYWEPSKYSISCLWRYNRKGGLSTDIPFILDGYDLTRIDYILEQTGWCREGVFSDMDISKRLTTTSEAERLVVVARRAK